MQYSLLLGYARNILILKLYRKSKSINRKGAQALRNSPVGYFSAMARLQGWLFHKGHKELDEMILTL
jgi:hypothetical protein